MSGTRDLVENLKRCLKSRGLTYRDLARETKLSEASVKRIFSRRTFTLERLEQICGIVGTDFFELSKMSRPDSDPTPLMNDAQDRALARDPKLFSCFYLVVSGLSPEVIAKRYKFTPPELTRLLVGLDRLGLVRLHAGSRVQLLASRNIRWVEGGALNRLYDAEIKKEFLQSEFAARNERLRLLSGHLSEQSLKILSRKLDKLLVEFQDLSETDTSLAQEKLHPIWLLVAHRPWVFSAVSELKR